MPLKKTQNAKNVAGVDAQNKSQNANLLTEHKGTSLCCNHASLFHALKAGLYMHLFLSHKLIKVLHYSSDCIETPLCWKV